MKPEAGLPRAYVLDDEAQIATIVCQHLRSNGYDAQSFNAVMPFIAETKAFHPALIVADLALGKSDAVEVIRHLEAIEYTGKVLLISGHDESTLNRITQIGASRDLTMLPPLQKPFRAADLKRALAAEPVQDTRSESSGLGHNSERPIDVGQALRNGWLEMWYQPKIALPSLALAGAEALLRAKHPERGIISAPQILPPTGSPLFQSLTEFVIRRAIADWRQISEAGANLKLAVNVPLSALQAANFMFNVRELLPKEKHFPGLIFEITEDEATKEPKLVEEIATQLRLYNIAISIDDFGAGYSSFARLQELPFVELKLDRSFVANCSTDGAKQSICSAAIELAYGFGATVCAEGIETIEDLKTLLDMRCHAAQGYLFSKPLPVDQFIRKVGGGTPKHWKPAA